MKKKLIIIISLSVLIIVGVVTAILINSKKDNSISNYCGYSSNNYLSIPEGFYYIVGGNNQTLHFFDYKSKVDAVVCTRPNCDHTDPKTCDAIITDPLKCFGKSGDSLYLICDESGENINYVDAKSVIYKENKDGSGRTELMKLNSISTRSMVIDKNYLYYMGEIDELDENKKPTGMVTFALHKVDLISKEDKKVTEDMQGWSANAEIFGYSNGKICYGYDDFKGKYDFMATDWDSFVKYYKENINKDEVYEYDCENETSSQILKDKKLDMSSYGVSGDKLFYCDNVDNKQVLKAYDLNTKEEEKIEETDTKLDFSGIFDNKLFYSEVQKGVSKNYYYDLKTKEKKQVNVCDKVKFFISIQGENGDSFIVIKHAKEGEESIGTHYGYISKADFYNNNPNVKEIHDLNG